MPEPAVSAPVVSARVHAVVVARPDGRAPAAHHLRRTLDALRNQTLAPAHLTVVLCGPDNLLATAAGALGTAEVVTLPHATSFAEALNQIDARLDGDAVWLLAQDTAPEPDALAQLTAALDLAPSVAFVAPKLVNWDDRSEIVSLGQTMTRFGTAIEVVDTQLDQGQHDTADDVLGADVRGILIRRDAWRALRGLDRGLGGADEGLDLGVRARLAGGRVSVVPSARLAVAGDGVAGLAAPTDVARERHRTFASRRAQLQRRLAYAAAPAVPFLWLAVLPIALWRTILQLVGKAPGRILPEWSAAIVAMIRVDAVSRARRSIHATRVVSWSQLAPLRMTRAQLNQRLSDESGVGDARARSDLRFFTGGGAWVVLAALVVSIAAFPALLAWPVLAGGALEPLRATVAQLWADAAYGQRPLGLDSIGPADPFSAVIALLGSLSPASPSRAIVLLWLLALPLAALGGWFAATRLTERAVLRNLAAVAWALAPTLLAALSLGRPAAVIAHLLLPWLFYAGSIAYRSWSAAGTASLLFVGVVACAPSLAPALIVLWLIVLVFAIARRRLPRRARRVVQVVWVIVPALVLAAPLLWRQLRLGNPWGLLADPGVPWSGPQAAADLHGRALVAMGFPTADPGGWGQFLSELTGHTVPTWWVPLLLVPLALLALLSALTRRWLAGTLLLVVTVLGIGTAITAAGVSVSAADGAAVALWPGTGLSLAWAGVVGAAVVSLEAGPAAHPDLEPRGFVRARLGVVALLLVTLAILAVPGLTAHARGGDRIVEGASSTLPAYVAAVGRHDPDTGTLVLTPLPDGNVASDVVWGESETLGGQSTAIATRPAATPADAALAGLSVDLVTTASTDVVQRVAARGIGYVLLESADGGSDVQAAFRLSAETALNQREGLESVGETAGGTLWRITVDVAPRPAVSDTTRVATFWVFVAGLVAVGAALLLAVPTPASWRRARRWPRVVGASRGGRS